MQGDADFFRLPECVTCGKVLRSTQITPSLCLPLSARSPELVWLRKEREQIAGFYIWMAPFSVQQVRALKLEQHDWHLFNATHVCQGHQNCTM